MTPLDAAQRLVARGPFVNDICLWCTYTPVNTGRHAADCPSPHLPKIVAALEAMTRLSDATYRTYSQHTEYVGEKVDGSGTYSCCRWCDLPWPCDSALVIEAHGALISALKGEEAPS